MEAYSINLMVLGLWKLTVLILSYYVKSDCINEKLYECEVYGSLLHLSQKLLHAAKRN